MMATIECPHCGRAHRAEAQFCPVTGQPLGTPPEPEPAPPAAPRKMGFGCVLLISLSLFGLALLLAGGALLLYLNNEGLLFSSTAKAPNVKVITATQESDATNTPTFPTATPTLALSPTATPTLTLTPTPTATDSPTVAPFGGQIVFVSYRDGDEEIYRMNADGTEQTRLTFSQYGDTEPMLSPDGRFIVFVSQRAGGHKLFIMNADGTEQHQLTDGKSDNEYSPTFSPDGQWVAYSSGRGQRVEIWRIRLDGTELTQITAGLNGKALPAWSPDGHWIAYNSVEGTLDVIKRIRYDGTEDQILLMLDDAYVSGWVGQRILFVAPNDAKTDIFSMNADSSDIRQLTTDPASDKGPFGTADGRFIIFNSARDGDDELYVMNADGAGQTRLTFSEGNDYMPAWGP